MRSLSQEHDSTLQDELSTHAETVPHSELGYRTQLPRLLAFCPATAENVTLVDLRKAREALPFSIVPKLFIAGLQYMKLHGDEVSTGNFTGSWQARFGTKTWSEAVSTARQEWALGGPDGVRLERNADGQAVVRWQASAVALIDDNEQADKEVLVNSMLSFRKDKSLHVRWGNGAEISSAEWDSYEMAMNRSTSVVSLLPAKLLSLRTFSLRRGNPVIRLELASSWYNRFLWAGCKVCIGVLLSGVFMFSFKHLP